MAVSQKHPGWIIVPWYDRNEWLHVYNNIFGEWATQETKLKGLESLKDWKIRMPRLPIGVEGTLIILDALLHNSHLEVKEEYELCVLYSYALMRFLNVCFSSGSKQGTFYKTAKESDFPDWLIDLRHTIAHSHVIPSLFMLELGLQTCLDWIKREYWVKQKITLEDVHVPKDVESLQDTDKNLSIQKSKKRRIIISKEDKLPDGNEETKVTPYKEQTESTGNDQEKFVEIAMTEDNISTQELPTAKDATIVSKIFKRVENSNTLKMPNSPIIGFILRE